MSEHDQAVRRNWERQMQETFDPKPSQSDDIQPLLVDEHPPNYPQAWTDLKKQLGQAFMQGYQGAQIHKHGPFVFIMNQNHNALRGCTACGAAWVGRMDDSVKVLCWHPIHELGEEEEEE